MDCGSQRDKAKIVAYMVWRNLYKEKAGRGGPVRQEKGDIEVFSNDFATVYFREDYATIAAPKRQNFGEKGTFDVFRLKRRNCGDI